MKKRKKKTGKMVYPDMTSIVKGKGGKDKDAHKSHLDANRHHGMPEGMQPCGGYDGAAAECEPDQENCAEES